MATAEERATYDVDDGLPVFAVEVRAGPPRCSRRNGGGCARPTS
jgi:hypothetical protein